MMETAENAAEDKMESAGQIINNIPGRARRVASGDGEPYDIERIVAEPAKARFHPWGVREYGQVLAVQERLREERRQEKIIDTWLAGEHETVATLGVRGASSDIIAPGGIPTFAIDRGGQTTLHNPGQLVIYPILKTQGGLLAQARMSRTLLLTARDWIADRCGVVLDIPKGRPGLFHGERKLAAIGLSVHSRITMHGIAINLCNDLTPWRAIIACGEPTTRPITLSEILGRTVTPGDFLAELPAWLMACWGYGAIEETDGLFAD